MQWLVDIINVFLSGTYQHVTAQSTTVRRRQSIKITTEPQVRHYDGMRARAGRESESFKFETVVACNKVNSKPDCTGNYAGIAGAVIENKSAMPVSVKLCTLVLLS